MRHENEEMSRVCADFGRMALRVSLAPGHVCGQRMFLREENAEMSRLCEQSLTFARVLVNLTSPTERTGLRVSGKGSEVKLRGDL